MPRAVCADAHGPSLPFSRFSLLKAAKRDVNICTAAAGLRVFVLAPSQLMYFVPGPIPSPGLQERASDARRLLSGTGQPGPAQPSVKSVFKSL